MTIHHPQGKAAPGQCCADTWKVGPEEDKQPAVVCWASRPRKNQSYRGDHEQQGRGRTGAFKRGLQGQGEGDHR